MKKKAKSQKNLNNKKEFYEFYKQYFSKELKFILLLLGLIAVGILITNITPYLYGKIIDYTTTGNANKLPKLLFLYFFITIGSLLLSLLETYFGEWLTYRITNHVKDNLFHKIIRMKCVRLDQYQIGELMARLNSDASTIVEYFINVATSIITIIFNLIVAFIFVLQLSKTLTMISLLFVPLFIFINLFFRKYYRQLHKGQKEFGDRFSSFLVETLSNIIGFRAYSREDAIEEEYHGFIREQWGLIRKEKRISNIQSILSSVISCFSVLILIYTSARLIMKGSFSIGDMVSYMTYIGRLNGAISQLLALNIQAQNVIISMKRIHKMQNEPDEQEEYRKMPEGFSLLGESILLHKICFRYTKEKERILDELDLELRGKGLYSIVGVNGSGKTSILKLLIKYYNAESGEIQIDGWDCSKIDIKLLRKQIAYIPKEPYIMNKSILENLLIANPQAEESDIKRACTMAGLDEFIQHLPEHYQTKTGENGKLLSSGQKQKLGIARAILCNPKIYLLDEITSDLDGKAEKEIIAILKQLAKEKIVLMVTHRLTSVIESKKIFLLEDKKITDSGTHEELLHTSLLYCDMFKQQSEEDV